MYDGRLRARVLHGHIQGEWNQGRIAERWIDNIKEDIIDLGLRQVVDMTRQNEIETELRQVVDMTRQNLIVNQWLTEERKRRDSIRYCNVGM